MGFNSGFKGLIVIKKEVLYLNARETKFARQLMYVHNLFLN